MSFKITHTDGQARIGQLNTAHGVIETPFFMPAATKATGKVITTDDYNQINIKAIIANSLILSLKPGIEVITKAGGLHQFMNFPGIIFTDCGGFQMSRQIFEMKSKKGLHFRNPYNNSKVVITPPKIMEIQIAINSDVAMMLDDMPNWGVSYEQAKISLENTHRWGKESLKWHQELKKKKSSQQLLFGIVQGNFFPDLRAESAKFINSLNFDGMAIGGVAIGEPKEKMYEAVDAALPYLTENKPRYVMGVGSPVELLELISRGIDCFDSVYPTQVARRGTLFTKAGYLVINQVKNQDDFQPVELSCNCHTCQNYSRAYLHHLLKINEPIGKRLVSIHNLFFIQQLIEQAKQAIKEKRFTTFKEIVISKFKPTKNIL